MTYTASELIEKAKSSAKKNQGRTQYVALLVKDTSFKSKPKRNFEIQQIYDLWIWNVSSANSQKLIERFSLRDEDADIRLSRYTAV